MHVQNCKKAKPRYMIQEEKRHKKEAEQRAEDTRASRRPNSEQHLCTPCLHNETAPSARLLSLQDLIVLLLFLFPGAEPFKVGHLSTSRRLLLFLPFSGTHGSQPVLTRKSATKHNVYGGKTEWNIPRHATRHRCRSAWHSTSTSAPRARCQRRPPS